MSSIIFKGLEASKIICYDSIKPQASLDPTIYYITFGDYKRKNGERAKILHPLEEGFSLDVCTRDTEKGEFTTVFVSDANSGNCTSAISESSIPQNVVQRYVDIKGEPFNIIQQCVIIERCFVCVDNVMVEHTINFHDGKFYCEGSLIPDNKISFIIADNSTRIRDYIKATIVPLTHYYNKRAKLLKDITLPNTIITLDYVLKKYSLVTPVDFEEQLIQAQKLPVPIDYIVINCADKDVLHLYPQLFWKWLSPDSLFYNRSLDHDKQLSWCNKLPGSIVRLFFYKLTASSLPTVQEIVKCLSQCHTNLEVALRTFCNLAKHFSIESYSSIYESIYDDMYCPN